jgi:hypothetical protein
MMMLYLFLFHWILWATAVDANNKEDYQDHNYPVTLHWFNTTVDHFNFRHTTVPSFPLRYYVNDEYYNDGPVFFYAGNEADILQFVNNRYCTRKEGVLKRL